MSGSFHFFTHFGQFCRFCQSKHQDTTTFFCKINFLQIYLTIQLENRTKGTRRKEKRTCFLQPAPCKHLSFYCFHMSLIEVKELSRWYQDNPDPLFRDLNFSLEANEFFVLTGHSGTGKTTLVKFITGKLTPPEKTIFYNTQDIATFTQKDIQILRKRMGIIFQDYQLLEDISVRENIIFPLHLYELGEIVIESKLKQVLQKINIIL